MSLPPTAPQAPRGSTTRTSSAHPRSRFKSPMDRSVRITRSSLTRRPDDPPIRPPPSPRKTGRRPSSCRRAQRALEPRRAIKSPRLRAPPPRGARAAVGVRARLPHFKVRVIISRRSLDGRSRSAAGPRRQRLAASLRSPLRAERARVQRASRRARPARHGHGVGRVVWRLSPPQPSRVRRWWCESFSPLVVRLAFIALLAVE